MLSTFIITDWISSWEMFSQTLTLTLASHVAQDGLKTGSENETHILEHTL